MIITKSKKKQGSPLAALCILSSISILFSGCSGIFKTPEPVVIQFGSYQEFPESLPMEELQKEFNAQQSGIIVEVYPYMVGGDIDTSQKRFDCYDTSGSSIAYSQVEGVDYLPAPPLALDSFIEGDASFDLEDYFPGTLKLVTSQGSILALPTGLTPAVMYYNKDLFDQHGLEYPQAGWTWDDFLQAAMAIRDPDAEVWDFIPRMVLLDVLLFIFQHGGNNVDDLDNPTQVTFTNPLTIEALDWYSDLILTYQVSPEYQ